MFKIKMMFNRIEGYKVVGYANTWEDAVEMVNALRVYYQGQWLDVYYMYN